MRKLVLFVVLLVSVAIFGQTDSLQVQKDKSVIIQQKFNQKKIEAYKNQKEFQYNEVEIQHEPTFLERFFSWIGRKLFQFLEWVFGVKHAKGIFAIILKSIPYIIAALVLFLLFKFFSKVNASSIVSQGINKSTVTYTDEEDLIKNRDLAQLIHQAIEQKNYRLAIRYYYLQLLQKLQENELIAWEQQKTNNDYHKEISQLELKQKFGKLTHLYDFVWYGNFEINEVEFEKAASEFQQTNTLIQHKKIG